MSERYDAQAVEAKWQAAWEDAGLFRAERTDGRPTYYVLEMFPYPSGRIHMGHVRNYTMGDVVARYKRARGFDVLHPMGWDAFGLPAENAAFERGVHPAEWTYANIATMRGQLRLMGLSIDWEREFATCHPGYYAHQQALFLDFFEAGLVERKEAWVNWDPVDNTVLANEQVVDGRGWRSGALIEKRRLAQWFFRITRFADELLEALEELPRWPDKVRLMQRNWIGRSEGARILFPFEGRDEALEVFTTRPDTLFGASFCALSPNHPLATSLAESDSALAAFIAECNLAGVGERDIEAAGKRGFDTGSGSGIRLPPAARCRSMSPTSCSWTMAPARSSVVPPTTSAISISPAARACPSFPWCARRAWMRTRSRSAMRPTSATARRSIPTS